MKTRTGKPLPEALRAQVLALEALPDESIDYSDAPQLEDWSGAVRGRFANKPAAVPRRVKLPEQVARVFEAVRDLQERYKEYERRFTVDGHLLGSIGEVIAAEAFDLKLHKMGHAAHDAFDGEGDVQIKITAGKRVAMYDSSTRLLVMQIVSSEEAEVVYDGPGQLPWEQAGKKQKNGQRVISLAKLRLLSP